MKINIKFNKFSFIPEFESGGGFDSGKDFYNPIPLTFDLLTINWLGLQLEIEYNFKIYKQP